MHKIKKPNTARSPARSEYLYRRPDDRVECGRVCGAWCGESLPSAVAVPERHKSERENRKGDRNAKTVISALLRLLPTRPHTARQSGQRRGPYPYLRLNAWGKEPMRTKQSAPLDTGLTSRDPKGALPNPIFVVLACCRQCLPGAPKCRNDQIRI